MKDIYDFARDATREKARVRITCGDGMVYTGIAHGFSSKWDNEDGCSAILLKFDNGGMMEFSAAEIEKADRV